MRSVHIIIHGLVQGVFFRKHTQQKAIELAIRGFVRNSPHNTVEIEAEGDEDAMQKFIAWCHHGPPDAKVSRIDIHEQGLKNYSSFIITR